jgi:hypothetical protein
MAVGYGLVTVSGGLPVSSRQGQYPDITLPTPIPAAYQSRLAWVLARHGPGAAYETLTA